MAYAMERLAYARPRNLALLSIAVLTVSAFLGAVQALLFKGDPMWLTRFGAVPFAALPIWGVLMLGKELVRDSLREHDKQLG